MIVKFLVVAALALFLVGCDNIRFVATPPVQQTVIHPPPPPALTMREVEWRVLNRARLEMLLAGLEPGEDIILFVLTQRGYENLSLNIDSILRYIKEQRELVIYYRELFPTPEELKKEE